MEDNIIIPVVLFGGFAAVIIYMFYFLFTMKARSTRYYEGIKDTDWIVERWSGPQEISFRYFLFGMSIMIPFALWEWLFDYKLEYGILLLVIWLGCYVPLVHHYLVRPSLRGTSYKARNRNLKHGEVTSFIGMALDDMGVPHKMYTFQEYQASGPDTRLYWELCWEHRAEFIFDLHPDLRTDRTYSIAIREIGDVEIFFFSEILLTPYDDETAPLFDKLSDEIDRVLF